MKRKRSLILMMTLLLVVEGVNAQKIDQRLTRLIEQVNARRAQGQRPVNAEAVNKTMVVDFNADSVDAPVYNMMGQRVNKSQKGLVIYKGRKYVNK